MILREIFDAFCAASRNAREKGDYLERLVRVFLPNDNTQKQFYFG